MATTGINAPSIPSSQPADRAKLTSQADAFDSMKMEDFLKLMITQLQNQDPMNPMDNSQMAAELAQFATLSTDQDIDTNVQTLNSNLTSGMQTSQVLSASNLVGKQVLYDVSFESAPDTVTDAGATPATLDVTGSALPPAATARNSTKTW